MTYPLVQRIVGFTKTRNITMKRSSKTPPKKARKKSVDWLSESMSKMSLKRVKNFSLAFPSPSSITLSVMATLIPCMLILLAWTCQKIALGRPRRLRNGSKKSLMYRDRWGLCMTTTTERACPVMQLRSCPFINSMVRKWSLDLWQTCQCQPWLQVPWRWCHGT